MVNLRAVFLVFLFLVLIFSTQVLADELVVHFIDVGQGDSILIQGQGTKVLIDGGDRWDWVGERLISYLQELDIAVINAIISTHPHADHIGGLPAVIREFEVEKVYDSGRVHTTQTYENYLQLIFDEEIPYFTPRRGDKISVGGLEFLVLNPAENVEDYSLNDASIVLRLEYDEISFLFTGDAEERAELEMVNSGLPLESTILKVGHHGSRTSTNSFFLEEVSPQAAVIQVGIDNRYGHPHPEVLENLEENNVKIFRNDLHGNIIIGTDGKEFWVEMEKEDEDRGVLININTACIQKLQDLPGIGPVLAERINEYREKHGPFTSYEEIKKVQGIGPGTLEGIKNLIVLD